MAVFPLITFVVPLLLLAHGARISTRAQLDAHVGSETRVGPDWAKGVKYACVQKYETSKSKFVEKYCLANLDFALSIAEEHLQFSEDMTKCQGTKDTAKMKLCALKGDTPEDKTISYSSKGYVAKSCFRYSLYPVIEHPVIEAAVDASECTPTMEGQEILPVLVPETIVPEVIPTPDTPTEKEEDEVVEVEPAVEDDVATEDVEELVEAKTLFTSGEHFFWEYRGKAMKCCVSSAGKPTQLQDMNEELPSARSYGDKRGCGRMFGDTYHNGLKGHKGSDPTCPVPASLLADMTFEAKGLFTSEDLLWEYSDKTIKCCVSSAGKPTMLQDLKAEKLPSARMTGTTTGCGRMFGDTYHNGLKGHKGAEPSCPVPLTLLMETVGDEFGSIASLLE
jgi:hypothetical protein